MSDQSDEGKTDESAPRAKPTDRAWLDAKRDVADRNEAARKAGKKERADHEKHIAAIRRSDKTVYR
jgi:hypothetical protein